MKIFLSNLIVWCSFLQLHAENGHQLWLRPHAKSPVKIICSSTSPTLTIARRELQDGWQGQPRATVVLSLSKDKTIKGDGFRLEPNKIEANTQTGILYGVYELLRRQETGQPISEELCNPSYERRMLDHWDNPDGSIERGYAGKSIFWRKENPFVVTDSDRTRWREYARADASVGINGAVLNNVNASILILSADYLARVKAIADVLRPYGVRTYLSVRFSSPIQIAGLKTADPLDADVIAWWKEKVREIYRLIPDFGGFLVKANSEGQPGPQDYGRTHADGANMLADIIKPYGGIIMWRAFVYNASGKDRAKEAYTEFTPLDGQFRSNVILQVKNGPVDFQPREPFSPLFGAMKKTAVMPEFQITQEYLGQAIHLVFLAPTWEECLKSDTWQEGAGSTVGRCTDGSLYPQQHTAIAGVANIGLDTNWTGHPFAQANWYAFGRLAWNNRLTSDQIADEWLRLTFHPADSGAIVNEALWVTNFLRPVKEMMLRSRQAAVNYMMPLGLHHLFSANEHYGPGPWWAPKRVRADWTPPYYHKADTAGIGFDRTDNGSGAVDQYHEPLRSLFNDVATCPDIYLLWFHHLPWNYRMSGGRTLWEDLCYHYDAGVRQVRTFQDIWDRVQPYVDPEQFALVQSKLRSQSENAQLWKDACLLYFQQFSRQPIPYDIERPVHDLDEIIREDMRRGAIRTRPARTSGAQAAAPIRIWPTTPTTPTPPAGTAGEPRSRSMAPSVHADNGDGTFTNPVIMADFPDPDVIRVRDTYYMLTTTMFTFPGVPLLQSHDLVNWSYCTNIVKRMDESPCYNLDGCNRYGHGQWAGSLKYHNGLFYVLFNTLNDGAFLCTAADPSAKWNIRRLGRGFHDCGLLFDDNGKIYVASGYGKLYITEIDNNFTPVSKDSLVFKGDLRGGLEGSHVYHLNNYYYLYCTYGGADGFQVALRSKSIWGPYEEKIVIRETDHENVNFGIHQGALIQTQTGEWWTMLFIDKGPFGRFPSLQPVTWQDGWPVAGVDGKAVVTYKKPDVGAVYPVTDLPASDEFTTDSLGMQWSWNHNPDPENWSLKARPGYLRLSTGSPAPDLPWARNTLTQRALANYDEKMPTVATTKLDVEQMKDGDVAGLCVFQDPYAYIGVRQTGDVRTLVMVNNGATVDSVPLGSGTVYLRTSASNSSKKAVFEYSLDNKTFTPLGNDLAMRFSLKIFTGNKFALFNYATKTTGGYVDFDWFHMDTRQSPTGSTADTAALSSSAGTRAYYNSVHTYVDPVLPGDHPDPTLLKVGDDFYHCGSSFHFNPYLPIYHSKDLVHWEVIARVVPPAVAASFVTDRPSGGIWQGAVTYFYGSFWIYFSANGQWLCKAASPYGPWSEPVRVKTNPATGNLGYDNSIFVDDDGKPYMVMKNGQKVNRIQALGRDGQLTDTVINLDWINANLQYSWAEGPVMCKRHGYYYYFPAGDVSGGQYVLRTKKLTSDSTCWERLGDFFRPVTDPREGFRRPNHISAPIQLADGTWWTLGQSYEKYAADDWSGTGRQTSLYPVVWEGDRPWGLAPTTQPIIKPDLPQSGIPWTSAQGDDFNKEVLGLQWHFLNRKAARNYSLTTRRGWLRLTPDSGRTHLVQKETDHDYTAVTKVDLHAADTSAKAGIYLTNGNQHVTTRLYTGYENGQRIVFRLDTAIRSVANTAGNTVWLKMERKGHALSGYYSSNGATWISLGAPISAAGLDKTQPNFNSWVGASIGVFAEGRPADFDFFTCKDAFSPLTAAAYANYYGITTIDRPDEKFVTNTSPDGGWFMLSGVETGDHPAVAVELTTAATAAGRLEIWLDDLQQGTLAATIPIRSTGGEDQWQTFSVPVKHFKGHHDVFIKYPAGEEGTIYIRSIRFIPDGFASLIPAPPHTVSTEAALGAGAHTFRYTNPITRDTSISMRDHCIIKVGAKWYCVGTSNPVWTGHNPGVQLLVSEDCLHWRQQGWLIDAATLPPDCPYNGRFWAPEIHNIKNKYWLTINSGQVTAEDTKGLKHHSVWLFSSDSVAGPYRLVNGPLTPQYNNDATLFEDEDGQTYLYCSGNGLFQARIDLSTGKLVGNIQKFLDKRSPGNPDWMFGGIEGPFVIRHQRVYYMFFSTWTRGYEVGLLKAPSPLGPWVLASREPIFGTRKKGYRPELAASGGYADLRFQDSEDPYCETGHNALFEGPDGKLWSSCHYMMYEKRPYPYSQTFEPWELTPQLGIEPVYFADGLFHIKGPTWTEQIIAY